MNIDSFDRNKTLTALEERKEKKKESMKKMNNNLKYFLGIIEMYFQNGQLKNSKSKVGIRSVF